MHRVTHPAIRYRRTGWNLMGNALEAEAHRNDMETIYPFLFLGLVYSFLGPDPFVARMHFLVVFLGRMVHTVAYLGKLRAPTRSLAYTLAQLPCASMALQIVWEAARHL
ncbi:Prostaglandin E synthase [Camelus dromedarius]|uniref:Prostaglandin E synthase n=1 Tax=Camelus dromedarius TaxID=9838 RepID=A0A5N4EAX0_CAMDR|nr:Prostaglandin E synthase [Camelus dromedarius]